MSSAHQNISKNDMENIITTAFIKELQSHEYENEYTPELRLKVLYTHFKIIQLIQQENREKK